MDLKPKPEHAQAARTLAASFELVLHNGVLYMPVHWESEESQPLPPMEERIWRPLSRQDKRSLGNRSSKILFANDSELTNFDYMLRQLSWVEEEQRHRLFVRTDMGLRVLTEIGELVESDGTFLPNFLRPRLNTDEALKKEVFDVITEWVDSEEEAHSLLYHLATCLAPGWSAVKYVLLIGDGRNGKGLLLDMLCGLFGKENVSRISRQDMSERSPICIELNGKLLNVIHDGKMDYIKDSGPEKTLIAGEPLDIRMLYENGTTTAQTNALFIEGLNKEPKSRDKSNALQRRLVRFKFPKEYPLNHVFRDHMLSEEILGAFLSLLLDHYVLRSETSTKLAISAGAAALQQEQVLINSPMLQFLDHVIQTDPDYPNKLVGSSVENMVAAFNAWRLHEGYTEYSTADIKGMVRDYFNTTWKTRRAGKNFSKEQVITSIKSITASFLEEAAKTGEEDEGEPEGELVAD